MDADEIRTLLGDNIFERAKKYRKRIQQSTCTVNADGVRHISAMVQGNGGSYYYTQAWLRENGSFVSASCSCPYNQNGEGTYCKHIGALLLQDAEKNPPAPDAPAKKPESIPGVQRGVAGLSAEPRKDSYSAGLDMLFGRKWRGEEPETDYEAQLLLKRYQREDAQQQPQPAAQRTGFALLEPELTPHNGRIWLRLRVSDGIGGRQYLVKSIPQFLDAVEQGESVSYGKSLAFVHRWDAFAPDAQQLLRLLRRQVSARQAFEAEGTVRSGWEKGPAGGLPLTGEGLDALVELYAAEPVSGYGHADDPITYSFEVPESVSATVKDNAVIGSATVYLDGYEIGTVDLVTHQEYISDFRTDLKTTLELLAALILLLAVLSFATMVMGGGSLNLSRRRKTRRR